MAYFFELPKINDLTIGQQAALNEPNAIAISGGPGTGKSVVALWRHIRNYGTGSKRSLLLTYTKTLETYLAASATSENMDAGNAVDRTYWWTTHHGEDYDEIIVDEAQDVEEARIALRAAPFDFSRRPTNTFQKQGNNTTAIGYYISI